MSNQRGHPTVGGRGRQARTGPGCMCKRLGWGLGQTSEGKHLGGEEADLDWLILRARRG